MDTDSFVLEITTDDVYKDMKEDEDIYDTSNYDPKTHSFLTKIKRLLENLKMN